MRLLFGDTAKTHRRLGCGRSFALFPDPSLRGEPLGSLIDLPDEDRSIALADRHDVRIVSREPDTRNAPDVARDELVTRLLEGRKTVSE